MKHRLSRLIGSAALAVAVAAHAAPPPYTGAVRHADGSVAASLAAGDLDPPLRADVFDGRTFATWSLAEPAGHAVTVRLRAQLAFHPSGIGGNLVSAFRADQPAQLLWALRQHDDHLELVRWDADAGRFRAVRSRFAVPSGREVDVRVSLTPDAASLTVDGARSWTHTWFGHQPADRVTIGAEAAGDHAARRFRGRISELALESQRYQPLTPIEWEGRSLLLVRADAINARFASAPLSVRAYLSRLRTVWPRASAHTLPAGLRVRRWDDARGRPVGDAMPGRVDVNLASGVVEIGWTQTTPDATTFALEFDPAASPVTDAVTIPLVGAGEPVSVGRRDLTADAGQLLAGYPSVVDWEMDGDDDLLVASVIPRRVWLFENVAESSDAEPVLAAPVQVFGGKSLLTHDIVQLPGGRIVALAAAKDKRSLDLWLDTTRDGERQLDHAGHLPLAGLPDGATIFDVHLIDIDGDGERDLLLLLIEGDWWWPDGIDPWNKGQGNPKIGYGRGYDERNQWLGTPPIGSFWYALNRGTTQQPRFEAARPVTMRGEPIRVPTTQMAATLIDINGDGKRDLLAAVGVDQLLVFENVKGEPGGMDFDRPRNALHDSPALKWSYFDSRFELADWDRDGRVDVLMNSNPGLNVLCRVGDGFLREERVLRARGAHVWAETLVVPDVADLDSDGAWDIVTGDSSGYLSLFHNAGDVAHPLFPRREKMAAGGVEFHVVAGYSGSIQGPNEARWGYLAPTLTDWDGDGRLDVLCSDITGYVYWMKNTAPPGELPRLNAPEPIRVGTWPLKVRWRTRPAVAPSEDGGLPRLVISDEEGYLALYERDPMMGESHVTPGERLLDASGDPIKLDGVSGYNGRSKPIVTDWDRDGRWDVLLGQPNRGAILRDHPFSLPRFEQATVVLLRNVGDNDQPVLAPAELLRTADGEPLTFGNHSCAPAVYDADGDGWDDLFIGAETGFVHYYHRSLFEDATRFIRVY